VPIAVHVAPPVGRRSKTRWSAPAAVAVRDTVPLRCVPGSSSEIVGGVESTTTVTTPEAAWLPAASVTRTRRSYDPLATAVVSQVAAYGCAVSLAIVFQGPTPLRYSNRTDATPAPDPSEAVAVSVTVGPPTTSAGAGVVSEPLGAVLSILALRVWLTPVFPEASVAIARKS
jgi:hypothetical protein